MYSGTASERRVKGNVNGVYALNTVTRLTFLGHYLVMAQ
jgi:hypothetical protein